MRVMLDIDGVLADFNGSMERKLQALNIGSTPMPPEGPTIWEWPTLGITCAKKKREIKGAMFQIMEDPYFWFCLNMTEEGKNASRKILELTEQAEIFLITQRPQTKAHFDATRSWLDTFYPFLDRYPLIVVYPKVPLLDGLAITHVIDDHPLLQEAFLEGKFQAKLLTPDRIYNRNYMNQYFRGSVKECVGKVLEDVK